MIARIMQLLTDKGHTVSSFFRDSSTIQSSADKINAFFSGIWSYDAARQFEEFLKVERPDLIQIQNLYPLISPSILDVARRHDIPVVMRLSNYRLFCPNGLLMTKGRLCHKCMGGREYWGFLKNCESNILKSAGYAIRTATARRSEAFARGVTHFYAQTHFQRSLHVAEGFDQERISVLPNFVDGISASEHALSDTKGSYVAYSGRLSHEKGIDLIYKLAEGLPEVPFKLAGAIGDFLDAPKPPNVELLGHLSGDDLRNFYYNAKMLLLPSLWYEGFPGVALEAMSVGKPIVASNLGGMPEIVENETTGLLCEPGSVIQFRAAIEKLWQDDRLALEMGDAGRSKLLKEFTADVYYRNLMDVYETALDIQR